MAALLRLAPGTDIAVPLTLGLREAFLDREPADRAALFADVLRRLALPGLCGGDPAKATALLGALDHSAGC